MDLFLPSQLCLMQLNTFVAIFGFILLFVDISIFFRFVVFVLSSYLVLDVHERIKLQIRVIVVGFVLIV